MVEKRIKRPRDPIERAKLVGDIATGQVVDKEDEEKDEAAAALGRKGGKARAAKLTHLGGMTHFLTLLTRLSEPASPAGKVLQDVVGPGWDTPVAPVEADATHVT